MYSNFWMMWGIRAMVDINVCEGERNTTISYNLSIRQIITSRLFGALKWDSVQVCEEKCFSKFSVSVFGFGFLNGTPSIF